jgi:hypothetical protein
VFLFISTHGIFFSTPTSSPPFHQIIGVAFLRRTGVRPFFALLSVIHEGMVSISNGWCMVHFDVHFSFLGCIFIAFRVKDGFRA